MFICKVHNLCYPLTNLVYNFPMALKSVISTFSENSHIRNLLLLIIIKSLRHSTVVEIEQVEIQNSCKNKLTKHATRKNVEKTTSVSTEKCTGWSINNEIAEKEGINTMNLYPYGRCP